MWSSTFCWWSEYRHLPAAYTQIIKVFVWTEAFDTGAGRTMYNTTNENDSHLFLPSSGLKFAMFKVCYIII